MTTCENCKHYYTLGYIHGCRKREIAIFDPVNQKCWQYDKKDDLETVLELFRKAGVKL